MRCTLAGTVGVCLLASAALTAADFWQEKDFTAWSAQQVEKILTDSPWAKKVTVVAGSLKEEGLGGFQGGGAGFGGGDSRSGEGGSAEFQRVRRVTVTVAWISALPVRQALARQQIGPGAKSAVDQQQKLGEDAPFYTVAVIGLPLRLAAQGGTIDAVKSKTTLKPNKKERIGLADMRVFREADQSVTIEFLFPKNDAIILDDKEVEFVTKLGDVDLTKKFKLADMTLRGQLLL